MLIFDDLRQMLHKALTATVHTTWQSTYST